MEYDCIGSCSLPIHSLCCIENEMATLILVARTSHNVYVFGYTSGHSFTNAVDAVLTPDIKYFYFGFFQYLG